MTTPTSSGTAAVLATGSSQLDTQRFRALYGQLVALEKRVDALEAATMQRFTELTNHTVTDSILGLSDAHARSAQRSIGDASSATLALKDQRNQVKTLKQAMYQSFEAAITTEHQAADTVRSAGTTE